MEGGQMGERIPINNQNQTAAVEAAHDLFYNLFILAITIYSLVVIVLVLVWPLRLVTRMLLIRVDLLICIVLVIDFFINLYRAQNKRSYFFRQWGWLDLLGSVPIIVGLPWTAVLRLARLPQLVRIVRVLRAKSPKQIRQELNSNQPKGTLLLTLLIALVMIAVAGGVVLQVEGRSPEANIRTGGDAFWWAFVTITTVGYGDRFPVTGLGRMMAVLLMTIGIGVFAVMTGFLASIFIEGDDDPSLQNDIVELRKENAAIRAQLEAVMQILSQSQQNGDE
jgi:voltage-gated potassium channel